MQQYIVKRILLFFPTIIFISLIVFVLMTIIPGDPAVIILEGERGEGTCTQEALDALKKKLGTDKSLPLQYLDWLWGMVRGDFGISLFYQTPITDDLKQKLPVTLELAFLGIILSVMLSVPLGIIAAVKQNTPIDYGARSIAILGVAMPNFWVAILVILWACRAVQLVPSA